MAARLNEIVSDLVLARLGHPNVQTAWMEDLAREINRLQQVVFESHVEVRQLRIQLQGLLTDPTRLRSTPSSPGRARPFWAAAEEASRGRDGGVRGGSTRRARGGHRGTGSRGRGVRY